MFCVEGTFDTNADDTDDCKKFWFQLKHDRILLQTKGFMESLRSPIQQYKVFLKLSIDSSPIFQSLCFRPYIYSNSIPMWFQQCIVSVSLIQPTDTDSNSYSHSVTLTLPMKPRLYQNLGRWSNLETNAKCQNALPQLSH